MSLLRLIGHVFEVSLRELFHLEAAPGLSSSRDHATHRVVEPCVDTLCQGQTIAQRDEGQPESFSVGQKIKINNRTTACWKERSLCVKCAGSLESTSKAKATSATKKD